MRLGIFDLKPEILCILQIQILEEQYDVVCFWAQPRIL
jgi:hypothetical protein